MKRKHIFKASERPNTICEPLRPLSDIVSGVYFGIKNLTNDLSLLEKTDFLLVSLLE